LKDDLQQKLEILQKEKEELEKMLVATNKLRMHRTT
jgi:hypothetical protein